MPPPESWLALGESTVMVTCLPRVYGAVNSRKKRAAWKTKLAEWRDDRLLGSCIPLLQQRTPTPRLRWSRLSRITRQSKICGMRGGVGNIILVVYFAVGNVPSAMAKCQKQPLSQARNSSETRVGEVALMQQQDQLQWPPTLMITIRPERHLPWGAVSDRKSPSCPQQYVAFSTLSTTACL